MIFNNYKNHISNSNKYLLNSYLDKIKEDKKKILSKSEEQDIISIARLLGNDIKISKIKDFEDYECLEIIYNEIYDFKSKIYLKSFKKGTKYKNMEINKKYDLKGLNIYGKNN